MSSYSMGPFDDMFDFDGNGEPDSLEKAAEVSFLDHISVVS